MPSLLLAALFLPGWLSPQIGIQEGPVIETGPSSISPDGSLAFNARIHSSESIRESRLILEFGTSRHVFSPQIGNLFDGYALLVEGDLRADPPFPFSFVTYWWEVDFQSGEARTSPVQTLWVSDSRFSWSRVEKNKVILYLQDTGSAEDIADLALLSMGTISAELEAPIPESVALVIYPNLSDFQTALGSRIRGWEGAVSSPEERIIIMAAAPGSEGYETLAVLIPHEMTHILLGEKWNSAYASLPLWLVEGTAAGYEMEPRPEADASLREAVETKGLIPIRTLCDVFPSEEAPALLAYAESKSFTAFLKDRYGWSVLRRVFAAYAGGADCESGLTAAGKPLSALEEDWLRKIEGGGNGIQPAWILVLTGFVLLAGLLAFRALASRGKPLSTARKEDGK